jgi:hypothetical protein
LLHLKSAAELSRFLWPDFVEYGGAVLLASQVRDGFRIGHHETLAAAESFHNHAHILDHFRHNIPTSEHTKHGYTVYDTAHADFQLAWQLGQRVAQMWFAKLKHDFPDYRFRVYLTKLDTPIVRFHRVRAEEQMWAEGPEADAAAERGDLIVYDSASLGAPAV